MYTIGEQSTQVKRDNSSSTSCNLTACCVSFITLKMVMSVSFMASPISQVSPFEGFSAYPGYGSARLGLPL